MSNLPSPNQYDPPEEVQEKHRKYLRAMGELEPSPANTQDPPDENYPTRAAQIPAWISGLSPRAIQVLKTDFRAGDQLLSWYSTQTHNDGYTLEINAQGFIVKVQANDVRLENERLILTLPTAAGVSFSLEAEATLKLRWEEGVEWQKFIYMSRLELGPGFPFFFMVFLKE